MPEPRRRIIKKKNRRIEVSVTRTVNLGNFESLKVQAGYAEDIKQGASIERKYNEAWNLVNYQIDNAIEENLQDGDSNVTQTRQRAQMVAGAGAGGNIARQPRGRDIPNRDRVGLKGKPK